MQGKAVLMKPLSYCTYRGMPVLPIRIVVTPVCSSYAVSVWSRFCSRRSWFCQSWMNKTMHAALNALQSTHTVRQLQTLLLIQIPFWPSVHLSSQHSNWGGKRIWCVWSFDLWESYVGSIRDGFSSHFNLLIQGYAVCYFFPPSHSGLLSSAQL